ncbi:protoporphyrinogen oxidase [Natronolimnohabitans sp. A-GB9]|uniref:protoporphyrinogen oxidase n=1 Tax=Natronolimnohabitans sp. A-GB9 TaxID=3069757 RepID=UPI0027B40DC6|nr:protoporphyrinogen oxidase [Natronolimnohabitans sp. A-GB9]MDQ2052861.1 protoporphyrinogen oxidase [Natronolimnohabitans sp. A-GB9]
MKVGVVGAGISGLTLVRSLAEQDVDVVAFEAREEPGGVVQSRHVDGHVVELGPQRLRLTPGLESMIEELGLRDRLQTGDDEQPIYVYHDGELKVAPLSVREALTTDLLGPAGKLRMLLEPLFGPPRPNETVDEFLVRKFGKQASRRYLGPLYSGLYGTDPRNMLVEYSLGRVLEKAGIDRSVLLWVVRKLLSGRETPPICTFEGGLGELTQGLYDAYADAIELGTPVETIRKRDDGFELVTADTVEYVDEVVLTTPAETCAELLAPVDSGLEATLRRFNYNPIGMVFLESDFDGTGIGTLVPPGSDVQISGLTWNASFLDRDGLFTCYIDPLSYPPLSDASDEELGRVGAAEFERITGTAAAPIHVHRWEPGMPAYDRSWTAMDDLELPAGVHLCTNFVDRPGIPGRIRTATRLARELADE